MQLKVGDDDIVSANIKVNIIGDYKSLLFINIKFAFWKKIFFPYTTKTSYETSPAAVVETKKVC